MENKKVDYAAEYELLLDLPRDAVTKYDLTHPMYETDEDFRNIMAVYERRGVLWMKEHKEGLKPPKRRPGRPRDAEELAARAAAAAERRRIQEEKAAQAAKAEERREARAQRIAAEKAAAEERRKERERRRAEKAAAGKPARLGFYLSLPDHVAARVVAIKGDLPTSECIVQLLEYALDKPVA